MESHPQWIHDLARSEIYPDADQLLQTQNAMDPTRLVEESTQEFMADLRDYFNDFARAFNSYSASGSKFQDIKIYQVANTEFDFMVFRNQVKLLISNSAQGLIQIGFISHHNGTGANASAGKTAPQTQELMAQIGPFRNVYWAFQGEKVNPEEVARYYFHEFTRMSRDTQRSKGGNQLLLDQIKALLQEKGLNL